MQTDVLTAKRTPFSLDDDHSYALWRARKLAIAGMPEAIAIQDPGELDAKERQALLRSSEKRNFALFHVCRPPVDIETSLRAFGRRLGLLDLDQNLCAEDSGITAFVASEGLDGLPALPDIALIGIGMWFRGPGWSWVWPGQVVASADVGSTKWSLPNLVGVPLTLAFFLGGGALIVRRTAS